MKWEPGELKYGDMVRVRLGGIYHYGVFVSEEEVIQFGLPPVMGNKVDMTKNEVLSTDIDVFSAGQIPERMVADRREAKQRFSPDETVRRAREAIGEQGYDLIRNNCEHFANRCVFGVSRSTQEEDARARWNSRPVFDVYIAEIPPEVRLEKVVPFAREMELILTRNEKLRIERYYVWRLLEKAVRFSFGMELRDLDPKKEKSGKWTCDGICFSLSHTDGAVAVSVSRKETGVDIENLDRRLAEAEKRPEQICRLAEKVLTEAECTALGVTGDTISPTAFYRLWTQKESIFKCSGQKAFVPQRIETSELPNASFVYGTSPAFLVSAAGAQLASARFFTISDGEVSPIKESDRREYRRG